MNYYVRRMGPELQKEVERQLIEDLKHYGMTGTGLTFDYENACQEGHETRCLGGELEGLSSIAVKNAEGKTVADGWMDFIHGKESDPLHVFWLFLDAVKADGTKVEVKKENHIPDHVWARLPDETKDLCASDPRWSKDPLVRAWKMQRGI